MVIPECLLALLSELLMWRNSGNKILIDSWVQFLRVTKNLISHRISVLSKFRHLRRLSWLCKHLWAWDCAASMYPRSCRIETGVSFLGQKVKLPFQSYSSEDAIGTTAIHVTNSAQIQIGWRTQQGISGILLR